MRMRAVKRRQWRQWRGSQQSDGGTHWLVSSAIRFNSTTPLSTRCLASSSTACQGLDLNLPLQSNERGGWSSGRRVSGGGTGSGVLQVPLVGGL